MLCKHPEGHFCLAKSVCGWHLSYLLSVTQQHSACTLREHHAWDSDHGNSLWGVDKCSIRKNVEYQRNTVLKHLTFHSTSFRQTGQWLSKMLKETWETEFRNRCDFFFMKHLTFSPALWMLLWIRYFNRNWRDIYTGEAATVCHVNPLAKTKWCAHRVRQETRLHECGRKGNNVGVII